MCKCKDKNDTKIKPCCILEELTQVNSELQRVSDILDDLIVAYTGLNKKLKTIGEANA